MGQRARQKPERLGEKLLAVRLRLGVTQAQMAKLLGIESGKHIPEWETGRREPNVILLLSYARVSGIPLEHIIDDEIELNL